MRGTVALATVILLVFLGSWAAQALVVGRQSQPAEQGFPKRILCLAPSVTETVFALGLGERVVGVSRFCKYPPEVQRLPKVGGYFDPNFEAIVVLQPDLVVLLEEQRQSMPALEKLGLRVLPVRHKDAAGILESLEKIGAACGTLRQAAELKASLEQRIEQLRGRTAALKRPRVLLVVDRNYFSPKLEDVQAGGTTGHLAEVIELAGGRSALAEGRVQYPILSREGLLRLDPDVIVELAPASLVAQLGLERLVAPWRELTELTAVRHGHVHVLADDRAILPGPNFVELAQRLANLIHPELRVGNAEDSSGGAKPSTEPEKSDKTEKSHKMEKSDKMERPDTMEKHNMMEKADMPEQSDKPEQSGKQLQSDVARRTD